jgi:hypothetical protein
MERPRFAPISSFVPPQRDSVSSFSKPYAKSTSFLTSQDKTKQAEPRWEVK